MSDRPSVDIDLKDVEAGRDVHVHVGPAPTYAPRPFAIPSPVADFTGREPQLATLADALAPSGRAVISAVSGMGGVGKSQLAFEAARRLRDRFPDGRIHLDMQGTGDQPLTPAAAMARVIQAFAPEAKPPDDPAQLAALYRAVLDGKRALLLLDNARDTAQVKPLLPPAPVALLVTSRRQLTLPGARPVPLDAMTPDEADAFLFRELGARATAEERANIATACGHLPLALRAACAYLAEHPSRTLAAYLADLRDERARLRRLRSEDDSDLDVAAVLGFSVRTLEREDPMLYRRWLLLAAFPAGFDAAAAVAIWEAEHSSTIDALDALARRSLLQPDGRGDRWRLHDLYRDLAREACGSTALAAALANHARHYCDLIVKAGRLYSSGNEGVAQGLALFDAERANIEAGQAWAVANLAVDRNAAMMSFLYANDSAYMIDLRLRPPALTAWLEAAVQGCRRVGDRRNEGGALGNLGVAWAALGEIDRAIECFELSLAIAHETGDRYTEGRALGNLGNTWAVLGDQRRAIEHYERRLAIARDTSDRRGEAMTLGNLGVAWNRLGEARLSLGYHERNLAIARDIGDRRSEGAALWNMALSHEELGDEPKAVDCARTSLFLCRAIEDPLTQNIEAWLRRHGVEP